MNVALQENSQALVNRKQIIITPIGSTRYSTYFMELASKRLSWARKILSKKNKKINRCQPSTAWVFRLQGWVVLQQCNSKNYHCTRKRPLVTMGLHCSCIIFLKIWIVSFQIAVLYFIINWQNTAHPFSISYSPRIFIYLLVIENNWNFKWCWLTLKEEGIICLAFTFI